LCHDRGMDAEAAGQFRQLCDLLAATFHFEYHQLLEDLKNEYAPFDPDHCTKDFTAVSPQERSARLDRLFERFTWLMERANFQRVSRHTIENAARVASDWGMNMHVDWSIFERFELFSRGDAIGDRYRRRWPKIWKLESTRLELYQRLVLIVKLKPSRRLPGGIDTDDVFIKIFKDIPKIDVEMLLPGARMRMPGSSRLKLGGSVLSGLAWVGYTVFKQIVQTAVLGLQFIYGPLLAIFGYGYRQWYGYQSTRTACTLRLTQSLYYQTLGNNLGVLFHLLDEAEEQECREAMLAYYCLWRFAGEKGWTEPQLDDYVEMDLERLADVKVDFEVDDALAKLERLNLVTRNGDRYVAVPIDKALESLDYAWDNYFKYNKEATV
jgi:hypothetical protein